jgi:cytoskeleton protein RodZ
MNEASSMSDSTMDTSAAEPARPTTAGGLLRQARQAQGLHIAALAAAIKVVPRKLELLESDQFDQLPDATFARALANTVCRTLKIDAAPVLALLPPLPGQNRLEHVAEGLKTPFEEGHGGSSSNQGSLVATPVLVLAAVLIVGALAVYAAPASWLNWRKGSIAGQDAAPTAASGVSETIIVPTLGASAPATGSDAAATTDSVMPPGAEVPVAPSEPDVAETAASAPVAKAAGVLQLTPSEASWIEVIDAHGKSLISRLVPAGESVGLDGAMPFKVKIGNANATQVVFRGQPLDLGPFTRDNMAKLQLK